MNIEIARVFNNPTRYEGEEPSSIFELDEDRSLRFEGPLRYDIMAEAIPGELVVQGRLSVRLAFACSRCGEFSPRLVEEPRFACSKPFDDPYESVNLTDEMRETMILLFPSYPVCRADCRGLCAQCGMNLNTGTCSCRPPEDNRWDVLDELKQKMRR